MMRSMFTGVAGLRTHQTKMDVIGNNIANVNTVGFKSSAVTFKEIFAQTIQGASQANEDTGRGGTNPLQIGLGVAVASIDNIMTQGAAQVTDNPLDLMINGNAFFVVGDNSGYYFTRAGAFRLDAAGNLVNPAGLNVFGWGDVKTDAKGNETVQKGKVSPLVIKSPANMYSKPEATTNAEFAGNLSKEESDESGGILKSVDFHDSLGNHYKLEYTFTFVKGATAADDKWTMVPGKLTRNETQPVTLPASWIPAPPTEIKFNVDGTINTPTSLTLGNLTGTELGINAVTETITIDLSGVTQFTGNTDIKGTLTNGCTSGELIGFSIGPDGIIRGTYSNGRARILGQIAVANFKNPAGLEKVGDSLFVTSANSGGFDGIGDDPTYGGGSLGGGRLEMSNVDLAREFTEMITTQRGFQANARTITTSDEMLQELVRLK